MLCNDRQWGKCAVPCACVFIRVREDVQVFAEVKIPSWETGTWTGALCQEIQSNVLPDEVWTKRMRILLSSIIIIAHSLAFIVSILTAETGILNLSCSVNLVSVFQNLTGLVSPPAFGWNISLVSDSHSGCMMLIWGWQLKISQPYFQSSSDWNWTAQSLWTNVSNAYFSARFIYFLISYDSIKFYL